MATPNKIFYCPSCQKDTTTIKQGNKSICKTCGGDVKVRCWGIRFRVIEFGKQVRKCIYGKTEREVKDSYIQFMATYQKPTNSVDAPIYKLKFENAYQIYLKSKAGEVKQSTYYDNIKCFNTNILPFFSGRLLVSITTQDIRDWQNYLVDKGYAFKTKQKNRAYLNNMFVYFHRENGIENVVERVAGFSKKLEVATKKEMTIIEPNEYKTFESIIPNDNIEDRTLFNILYLCQPRKGEVCALTWNDWLQDKSKLYINKTFSRISLEVDSENKYPIPKADIIKEFICGKRSKYIIHSPKSINSTRKIDLPQSTIDYLEQLYEIKSKEPNFTNDDFIFGKNGKYMNYTTLSNRFEKYKALAKINPSLRVHDLRHSGVSMLINTYQSSSNNINTLQLEYIIAERIGDTVEQVIKTYGHLFNGIQSIVASNIKL